MTMTRDTVEDIIRKQESRLKGMSADTIAKRSMLYQRLTLSVLTEMLSILQKDAAEKTPKLSWRQSPGTDVWNASIGPFTVTATASGVFGITCDQLGGAVRCGIARRPRPSEVLEAVDREWDSFWANNPEVRETYEKWRCASDMDTPRQQ